MGDIYSKRHKPRPETFRYDVPERARWRIYHTLDQLLGGYDLRQVMDKVGKRLQREYGALRRSSFSPGVVSKDPVVEHFICCEDDEAVDFVEVCVRIITVGLDKQRVVPLVNDIFREEGIGYELTPWVKGGKYPQAVRKDSEYAHEKVVLPALEVLSQPVFKAANGEMLKAHEHYRKGNFDGALTACGSAFESVLKTICDQKGWAYDASRDTCAKLVVICKDKKLFPSFYAPILETTGTIRNKLGDAHGRGPAPAYVVGSEHVQHMVQMTSSHIILLVNSAGL